MFMHSPNPIWLQGWPVSIHDPMWTWLRKSTHTLQLTPQMAQDAPSVPEPPLQAAPQLQPTYIPPWPTAQSGHGPLFTSPASTPSTNACATCTSHTSPGVLSSAQHYASATHTCRTHLQHHPNLQPSLSPGGWAQMPYFQAPHSHTHWLPSCTWPQSRSSLKAALWGSHSMLDTEAMCRR